MRFDGALVSRVLRRREGLTRSPPSSLPLEGSSHKLRGDRNGMPPIFGIRRLSTNFRFVLGSVFKLHVGRSRETGCLRRSQPGVFPTKRKSTTSRDSKSVV